MSGKSEAKMLPAKTGLSAAFALALFDPSMDLPEGVIGPDGKPAPKRFNVYRNNVVVSLMSALAEAYPSMAAILGEENFQKIARSYVGAHPPKSAMMQEFGREFSDFLRDFKPLQGSPFFLDLAILERAWLDAYHAADCHVLAPDVLGTFPPDQLGGLVFTPHPALHLIASRFPVCDLFQRRYDDSYDIDLEVPQYALITRPHLDVQVRNISPEDFEFINTLKQEMALEVALANATQLSEQNGDPFDPARSIGLLLESGAFSMARLPDGAGET